MVLALTALLILGFASIVARLVLASTLSVSEVFFIINSQFWLQLYAHERVMNHQLTIKCSPPYMHKKSFSSLKIEWSFFVLSVTIVTLSN